MTRASLGRGVAAPGESNHNRGDHDDRGAEQQPPTGTDAPTPSCSMSEEFVGHRPPGRLLVGFDPVSV